jgi:hypothetical protein
VTAPRFQLGRLPAVRPHGLSDLAVYVKGKLPTPPASVAVPNAQYPIDGNDTYGDCTMAGAAHLVAAWNAEMAESDPVPTSDQVVAEYFNLSGGADSGLAEADVLKTWQTTGLFGSKIAAYAPVNPDKLVAIHQAIAFYGAAYLGIACPESAQQQFGAGQPWTYVKGSPVEGGHCIDALGYTQTGLLCATWGGVAEVTYGFLAHFLDEVWCVIPDQIVEAGHGPSDGVPALDLAALQADLKSP